MFDPQAIQQQVNDEVARLIGRQSIDLITLQVHNRTLAGQVEDAEAERAKLKEWTNALDRAGAEDAGARVQPIR